MVMRRGVQLDELMIRTIDIGKEEPAGGVAAADVTDVGNGGRKLGAAIDLFLIGRLHVFGTPTDVPNGGGNISLRRLAHFVEQQPRLLRPHRVHLAGEARFLAIELGGIEIDSRCRVGSVQMDVVKMS